MEVMDSKPSGRTRLWLGGLASAGVVAAHQLAYVVAAPDAHERAELLRAGGHGHWSSVVAVAMGLLALGLMAFLRRGLQEAPSSSAAVALRSGVAVRLALLQGTGFVALEALERFGTGAGPARLWEEPAVLIGVALQVLIALATAAVVALLGRAVARWVARRAVPARIALRPARPVLGFVAVPAAALSGSGALRGPPRARL
jgi:hypothetical protein